MKHGIRIATVVTLVVIIIGGTFVLSGQAKTLTTSNEGNQAQATNEAQRTVSVSGSGQVQAQPDQAIVRLGVQTQAEAADQALSENTANMQVLLGTLK